MLKGGSSPRSKQDIADDIYEQSASDESVAPAVSDDEDEEEEFDEDAEWEAEVMDDEEDEEPEPITKALCACVLFVEYRTMPFLTTLGSVVKTRNTTQTRILKRLSSAVCVGSLV